MISLVIPTIDGREKWLEKAMESFKTHTSHPVEYLIIDNKPTCGEAWNVGLRQAMGDYILLSADDIEATPNWDTIGMEWADKGYIPCPRVLNTDGSLQSCGSDDKEHPTGTLSDLARVPFLSAKQAEAIGPILPIHYATDYWVTHRGRQEGHETIVVREFQFIHHYAKEGRKDDRLMADMEIFWKAAARPGRPLASR